MSFFEQIAGKTMPQAEEAEVKLDLSGVEKGAALEKLDAIVKYCKKTGAASLYVYFDPAKPGGGETLFQPVMRYLKIEKFNKYVSHAVPLMAAEDPVAGRPATAGIFVVFNR